MYTQKIRIAYVKRMIIDCRAEKMAKSIKNVKKQRAIYLCIINKSAFLRRSMNPQYKTVKCINRCHWKKANLEKSGFFSFYVFFCFILFLYSHIAGPDTCCFQLVWAINAIDRQESQFTFCISYFIFCVVDEKWETSTSFARNNFNYRRNAIANYYELSFFRPFERPSNWNEKLLINKLNRNCSNTVHRDINISLILFQLFSAHVSARVYSFRIIIPAPLILIERVKSK